MARRRIPALQGDGLPAPVDREPVDGITRPLPPIEQRCWTWTRNRPIDDDADLTARFEEFAAAGVHAVNIGGADERSCRLARAAGLEPHAWFWTLCRTEPELMAKHPEWYAVNRRGESTRDRPPYVPYYRFLCPARLEVREHLVRRVSELATHEWLAGVHLDYVRLPDVILPRALWPRYGLVQEQELPEFDYCYCEVCRERFASEHGVDPLELPDPPADDRWRRFRLDIVTELVVELAAAVHGRGKLITAAVFPTPEIARSLVRQDWPRWPLDLLLPMIYHNFYDRPSSWIETAVAEGRAALPGGRALTPALYLPALGAPREFEAAVKAALDGGAQAVAIFGADPVTPDPDDSG